MSNPTRDRGPKRPEDTLKKKSPWHANLPSVWHKMVTKYIPWELAFGICDGLCALKIFGNIARLSLQSELRMQFVIQMRKLLTSELVFFVCQRVGAFSSRSSALRRVCTSVRSEVCTPNELQTESVGASCCSAVLRRSCHRWQMGRLLATQVVS